MPVLCARWDRFVGSVGGRSLVFPCRGDVHCSFLVFIRLEVNGTPHSMNHDLWAMNCLHMVWCCHAGWLAWVSACKGQG